MLANASCLIKTRIRYSGFPEKFQYYPETMNKDTLEKMSSLALEMMEDPRGILTEDHLRKCVISDRKHLILGIGGFLADILKDKKEEYNDFCDLSGTRKVYGFFAFVWDMEVAGELPAAFPDTEEFAGLIDRNILPFWDESDNSLKAESFKRGIPAAYDCPVKAGAPDNVVRVPQFNSDEKKTAVIHANNINAVLNVAVAYAGQRKDVSVRTGTEMNSGIKTAFGNWIIPDSADRIEVLHKNDVSTGQRQESKEQKDKSQSMNSTPWQTSQIQDPVNRNDNVRFKRKWLELSFQVRRRNMLRNEMDAFINILCNISGAVEFDGPYIDRQRQVMIVALLVSEEVESCAVVREISQDIRTKQERDYIKWISAENIAYSEYPDNDDSVIHQVIDGFVSGTGKIVERFRGGGSRKNVDKTAQEGQKIIDQLEELYGKKANAGKKDNVFKSGEFLNKNPFDL